MAVSLYLYKAVTDDLEPGASTRVNHDDCGAGEDTRRRLYLTRPLANPSVIIAYCHNCQQSAYSRTGEWTDYRDQLHISNVTLPVSLVKKGFDKPKGMVSDTIDWPVHAQAWAYKGKLDSVLVAKYGIEYDVNSDRVYLPRFKATTHPHVHNLQAYQLRNTDPKKNVPKYLTVCSETDNGYTIMYSSNATPPSETESNILVIIVEDYLSGIAITEAYQTHISVLSIHVLVNYGTKINLEALHKAAQYSRVLVWLDNDSDHIKEQAETMARTVRLMSSDAEVGTDLTHSDPKHYTNDDLRNTIDEWIC